MSLEIEAKIKVDDLSRVRATLKEKEGQFLSRVKEVNLLFDTPERSLQRSGRLLRLRQDDSCKVAYKGPPIPGTFKTRQEVEVEVDDFERAQELLKALGFEKTWRYEKERETWRLGDALICLDQLPYLGSYVEIEAPAPEVITETAQLLSLGKSFITLTYLELFQEYCHSYHMPFRDMVF